MKYYFLSWKHRSQLTSAIAEDEDQIAFELITQLEDKDEMPFDFELKKLSEGKKGLELSSDLSNLGEIWVDYQPNSLAMPLMSARLQKLIDNNPNKDCIDWIRCNVRTKKESRPYYIPRFNKLFKVLNIKKTTFVEGTDIIINPVLSLPNVMQHDLFTIPNSGNLWKITSSLYVSEALKNKINKEKITGIEFSRVSVSET